MKHTELFANLQHGDSKRQTRSMLQTIDKMICFSISQSTGHDGINRCCRSWLVKLGPFLFRGHSPLASGLPLWIPPLPLSLFFLWPLRLWLKASKRTRCILIVLNPACCVYSKPMLCLLTWSVCITSSLARGADWSAGALELQITVCVALSKMSGWLCLYSGDYLV